MSEGDTEARGIVIWELRVATALPLPPWANAALISLAIYALYLIVRVASGLDPLEQDPEFGYVLSESARFALTLTLLIGLMLGAPTHVVMAELRDLQAQGLEDPSLDPRRDLGVLGAPLQLVQRSRLAGLAGLFVGSIVIGLMILGYARSRSHSFADELLFTVSELAALWTVLLGFAVFWLLGRLSYLTVAPSRSEQHKDVPIDLLNLRSLFVFGRAALRASLAWILGISIATAMFALNPGPGVGQEILVLPVIWLGIPALALLLPVRGLHRRIAAEKREELRHLDAAIRGDRGSLEQIQLARPGEELRLADLLAYKTYLEGLREWPFDTSTLSRFGLYLLIPLGSWLGGALVERVVNTVLD